jgi:hypothetical protein
MGWYGFFLVRKLKLAFSLRRIDEEKLYSDLDSINNFFNKYDKLRENMEYIQTVSDEEKVFSAKTTAKMFNIIDELGILPEVSDVIFFLYFLKKYNFDIDYFSEDKIDLNNLEKKGWKIICVG